MDIWWIILILIIVTAVLSAMLAVANYAHEKFADVYQKMFSLPSQAHMSVLEMINEQNFSNFNGKLRVAKTDKYMGDAYNLKSKTLILTNKTISSDSIGAFTIVAHELGHAQQDFSNNKLKVLKIFQFFGFLLGKLFLPAIICSLILLFFPDLVFYSILSASIAVAIFIFAIVIKMFNIYFEKDASKRAVAILNNFIPDNILKEAKSFLKSARLTYWSDLIKLLLGWSGLVKKTKLF